MNYKVIDQESYYRKGVFRHFTEDCKCSTSMTTRIDVTDLVASSKASGTKFYINFFVSSSKGSKLAQHRAARRIFDRQRVQALGQRDRGILQVNHG